MNYSKCISLLVVFALSLISFQSCVQDVNANAPTESKIVSEGIQWHSISELENLQKQSPKPVIVDIYTDWCKWCKVMDDKTFTDESLSSYIKDNYHMIKLNAEEKSQINFNGKTYNFVAGGRNGYHELASQLLNGQLSYPSFVVLNSNLDAVKTIKGFKNPEAFKTILQDINL